MPYQYNPHSHVKVWLSNNPKVFMNFENQTRLIDMREKNPKEAINLIYDSSLLNTQALAELHEFCRENNITPVDADKFRDQLISDNERRLFDFYKDEVTHLKEGGNLGVASDILRWLSASYRLGSYTDLDVPLNTSSLPETVTVDSPLLLNIGSLKLLGKKEMVLALNEYIAVVDEAAAKEHIDRIQAGILKKLTEYSSDYISTTEEMLSKGSFLNRILMGYMKNRAESLYIQKSTELVTTSGEKTSRAFRAYVNQVMTNRDQYLDFHKTSPEETHEEVIKRLRMEMQNQLGFVKWLFFTKDYHEVKKVLAQNDEQFVSYMMKNERSLYLKSIVICTTGPIEVGKTLFGNYVMNSDEVNRLVRPFTFSHYGLHNGFLSRNVIPLHENPLSMLKYLGADVGELNDSSWLDEGMSLQQKRQILLLEKQQQLTADLPAELTRLHQKIDVQIAALEKESKGFFSFFGQTTRDAKIKALREINGCFNSEQKTFDVAHLKEVLADSTLNWKRVFAGFFSQRTKNIIDELSLLCHNAIVLRVAKDKKLPTEVAEQVETYETEHYGSEETLSTYAPTEQVVKAATPASVLDFAAKKPAPVVTNPSACLATLFAKKAMVVDSNVVTHSHSPAMGA